MSKSFADRIDAAEQLAQHLQAYRGRHPLILAIPRGAVPMGKVLAERLDGELDVVLVRKLGAPFNPEFAIDAIDESGWTYLSTAADAIGASRQTIERIKDQQLTALKERRARYTPYALPVDPRGRIAIVVDDGLATGATMIAALHAVRAKGPVELVCAVPVAAADSLQAVKALADKVVCLQVPEYFDAVSQFYRDFSAVEDADVMHILASMRRSAPSREAAP
jgi:predicted phosphoribosyltransferase